MPDKIIRASVSKRLRKMADKGRARLLQRFFKTGPGEYGYGDVFIGLRVPDVRKAARESSSLPLDEAVKLLRSHIHEERLAALLIMIEKFKKGGPADKKAVYGCYLRHTRYINNWDLVDLSAPNVVGAYLADKNRDTLYRLARSKLLWERRIAMVATHCYIRKGDFADGLAIARILLSDTEDLMHKAVGWMLREIGKRDKRILEEFLRKYYIMIPRTSLRYAIERFPGRERKKYLKGDFK